MSRNLEKEQSDPLEEFGQSERIIYVKHLARSRSRLRERNRPASTTNKVLPETLEDIEERTVSFDFTYCASRYERQWLMDSLGGFYEQHWIDDVQKAVKGGKEASVYLCTSHPGTGAEYMAAKVYRPRRFRQLKNDAAYREGRINLDDSGNVIKDDRMNRAMNKRTAFGQDLLHTSWIEYEFQALRLLHDAGVDTPRPFTRGSNAILMEYIGDPGTPAPTLNSIKLSLSEARSLMERVLHNISLMLVHNKVHADLSAYNILYWAGEISIIDFPQVVNPEENRNAFYFFERDVTRVCSYFEEQGLRLNSRQLAVDLWRAGKRQPGPQIHPKDLDASSEEDRAYWAKFGEGR